MFLQQLQKLSSVDLMDIDQWESKRVAAHLRLAQAALHVSAVTQDHLKTETEKGNVV